MTRLNLIELYNRGLKSFESLSSLERDVFVVNDLDIYYEMEGDFADYLLSGGHQAELAWLGDTLQRIGDLDSAVIIASLRQMDDSQRDAVQPLCDAYHSSRLKRWELLNKYLAQQNAEIQEII